MKKIFYVLLTLFVSTMLSNKVYASSFNLSLNGNDTVGDEIVMDITLDSITDFPTGFYGLEATLEYDKEKIRLKEITKPNGFELTYDLNITNKFVIYTDTGISAGNRIATLKFSNLGLEKDEQTTITIKDIVGSNGSEDVPTSNLTKTVTSSTNPYIKGDLNKNNKIDLPDVIYLLKRYLGLFAPSVEDIVIGDMDGSGTINLTDIIMLLRLYLGV